MKSPNMGEEETTGNSLGAETTRTIPQRDILTLVTEQWRSKFCCTFHFQSILWQSSSMGVVSRLFKGCMWLIPGARVSGHVTPQTNFTALSGDNGSPFRCLPSDLQMSMGTR